MNNVTIVMPVRGGLDFTKASVYSVRKFYPSIHIILSSGAGKPSDLDGLRLFADEELRIDLLAAFEPLLYEDSVNMAAALVDTEFFLIMNNSVKLDYPGDQIEDLLEVMHEEDVAQSGAYGVVTVDWAGRKSYVGTDFTRSMQVSAISGYFAIQRTALFRKLGGLDKAHYYSGVPAEFVTHFSSDLALSTKFRRAGYKVVTPRRTLKLTHWTASSPRNDNPYRTWWYNTTFHIRISPLNNWKDYEEGRKQLEEV